jgi:hypothetical protein
LKTGSDLLEARGNETTLATCCGGERAVLRVGPVLGGDGEATQAGDFAAALGADGGETAWLLSLVLGMLFSYMLRIVGAGDRT